MFVVPDNTPKTMPDDEPIVAIAVLLLLHVPPVVASASDADIPTQTDDGPVIPAGSGFTVAGMVVVQPVPSEYVIVTVPVMTPASKPVAEPMVAMVVLLLLQAPPVDASLSVVVLPVHTRAVPVIVPGNAFTVTVATVKHPVGSVQVMVAVPTATPFTIPVADPTVAIEMLLLDHDPPVEVESAVVCATHNPKVPVMAPGAGLTVIDLVTVQPVPREYVIVTVPERIPDTKPDDEPTPPIAGLLLVQRPPVTASASGDVVPAQTVDAPLMAVGDALTVIVLVV